MAWLPCDPPHAHKRGGDHCIVVLRADGDLVQVHDPQSYPFAVLSIGELRRAWNARGIGYATASYTLRCDFRAERAGSEEPMLADVRRRAGLHEGGRGAAGQPAQYHAARRDWMRTAGLFDRLASLEARIAPAI